MAKKKKTSGHIEPKPTTYRGTTFRSRLEARWAVYLDYHPLVDQWAYEPRKYVHPETGWDYTPDFLVRIGTVIQCYLEVKPAWPSEEYLSVLSAFLPLLEGCNGHRLILAMGDFFQGTENPRLYSLPDTRVPLEKIQRKAEDLSSVPIFGHSEALRIAETFRFDLDKQPVPPRSRRKGPGPFDYWREYRNQQRKK